MRDAVLARGGQPGQSVSLVLDLWCSGRPDEQTLGLIDLGENSRDYSE